LSIREVLFSGLELGATNNKASRLIGVSLVALIAANVAAVVLESVPSLREQYAQGFHWFEIVSVVIFTVEYVIRVALCCSDKKYAGPLTGRLKYMLSPMAVIDLLAILPFYLPMFFVLDLRFLRALRLLRVVRIFKLGRHSDALRMLSRVFSRKKEELSICVFAVLLLLIIVSSVMFHVEHDAQPDQFSSIPATMWWGVATLTTVGYGDIYPITALGKMLAAVMALLGVGLFALPAGILASGFAEEIQLQRTKNCPHCGK
jgi:voltage-gated potassium channel